MSEKHCETCICGKRAPVQAESELNKEPGNISWAEHLEAHNAFLTRYGTSQSAEQLAERGGFSYDELVEYLGHEPKTWRPAP